MPGEEKNIPPSKSRRVAAARAGLLASGELMGYGAVFLAAAGVLHLWGPGLASDARDFVAVGVHRVLQHVDPLSATKSALRNGGIFVAIALAAALAIIVAVRLTVIFRQTAGTSRTAVPLPRFRPSRKVTWVIRGFAAFVLALAMLQAAREIFAGIVEFGVNRAEEGTALILSGATALLAAIGVIFALAGAAELLYERIAIWRALHLGPAEHKKEARDASGNPHIKAALRRRRSQGAP